jgi:hypothetical protein
MRRVRAAVRVSVVVVAVLLTGSVAVRCLRPSGVGDPPAWADDYDMTARAPEVIAPGTVVERGPPAGWSHLVIKSLPRVKASEERLLPSWTAVPGGRAGLVRRIAWMFTAFAADVVEERQGEHKRFRLRAIGLGLGANVGGRDTVLAVGTAEPVGHSLDFIQEEILKAGYRVQQQSRVVVHGPSFALVDTPVAFRCGEQNRMVRFRYALLVDPPTGRLDVVCWRIGAEGGACADLGRAVLLNPDTIDEAELVVDPSGFNRLGIPGELAVGVDDLPPYRVEVPLPPAVSGVAGRTRYAPEDAHALENDLRTLLPPGN